jgi:hypothetical protein
MIAYYNTETARGIAATVLSFFNLKMCEFEMPLLSKGRGK